MSRRARNASASVILRPELTAAVLASRPVCSSRVAASIAAAASPIAICTTSDSASLVTPRDTRPASAAQAMSRARRPSAMATGGSEYDTRNPRGARSTG